MTTTSLPSQEVHALNVPEPVDLSVDFVYNFFMPDEGVNDVDVSGTPFANADVDELGESFETFARRRVARYVKVSWNMPSAAPAGSLPKGVLAQNSSKIIDEGSVSSNGHFSIMLSDPSIASRVHGFVSGTLMLQSLGTSTATLTARKLASANQGLVSPNTSLNIVTAGLQQLQLQLGASFFDADGVELRDEAWDAAARVSTIVQLSTKFADRILDRARADPHCPYDAELKEAAATAARLADVARRKSAAIISDDDFKTFVPYISISRGPAQTQASTVRSSQIVGYIVEKLEHLADGRTQAHDPIIVDAPGARSIVDLKVRYGATYSYTVRSVAKATVQAIDDATNDVALIDFLVSSRPVSRVVVRCIELEPPPVPNDVKLRWDYESDNMVVVWNHPTNSQRDIKAYQVFRRRSRREPFQLLKHYSFNDAIAQNELTVHAVEAGIDPKLIEVVPSPRLTFVDPGFDRSSSFVYAVCAIDAHGLSSNYSAQLAARFDRYANALVVELVSHSGAPKPYPNMYWEQDLFEDAPKVSGPAARRMRFYFNPEFYSIVDKDGSVEPVLSTQQKGGKYVLQLINTDSQRMAKVDVLIDDRRSGS